MPSGSTPQSPRFTVVESPMAPLPIDHVDTDQIIPASFLKTTSREGLGRGLFAGWRRHPDGSVNRSFVLEDPRYKAAEILIAGDNFGCGSSREHAPWALLDHGIRAVVSTRFADIFRSNATKNGLLPVVLDGELHQRLMSLATEDPGARLRIDLEAQKVTTPWGQEVGFEVDAFARRCLLDGTDAFGYLLARSALIDRFEARHRVYFDTRSPAEGTPTS